MNWFNAFSKSLSNFKLMVFSIFKDAAILNPGYCFIPNHKHSSVSQRLFPVTKVWACLFLIGTKPWIIETCNTYLPELEIVSCNFVQHLELAVFETNSIWNQQHLEPAAFGTNPEIVKGATSMQNPRFHVAVRLNSNRSQMTSKCGAAENEWKSGARKNLLRT